MQQTLKDQEATGVYSRDVGLIQKSVAPIWFKSSEAPAICNRMSKNSQEARDQKLGMPQIGSADFI